LSSIDTASIDANVRFLFDVLAGFEDMECHSNGSVIPIGNVWPFILFADDNQFF
jgi:hypothetical protein